MSKRVAADATQEVNKDGKFARTASAYREIISASHPIYKPASGRYHLYISHACPWAHRTNMLRMMKGLQECISLSVVHPTWNKTKPEDDTDVHHGWAFATPDSNGTATLLSRANNAPISAEGCTPDSINNCKFIRDIYELNDTKQEKFTVPVLWDKETKTIVNNESSEILRMLNSEFEQWATIKVPDLYPAALKSDIDQTNSWVYEKINNGVYRCGFATSQAAYDEAVGELYKALDRVDLVLSKSRYLVGNTQMTEADLRLFVTLVRFDEAYVVYFKCNKRMISQYPHTIQYMREMYQMPHVAESVMMQHIKGHYYTSHPNLNCYTIIPAGPDALANLLKPHNRTEAVFPSTPAPAAFWKEGEWEAWTKDPNNQV